MDEVQVAVDESAGAQIRHEAGQVGEDLGDLCVRKTKPFADKGGFLIHGSGRNPATTIARAVDATIDSKVRKGTENLAALYCPAGDDTGAAPSMI